MTPKILIIHGDNHAESRNYLNEIVTKYRAKGHDTQHINGEKVTKNDLESSLLTSNLFTQELVVIENLLSRIKSKEKDRCLAYITKYTGNKPVVLWEKKELTKAALKKLNNLKPTIKLYKLPVAAFKFLSTLSPHSKQSSLELLHNSLGNSSDTFIFAMLIRQLNNLIVAKSSPRSLSGAPWQQSQLKKQAVHWELQQLLDLHTTLLSIDLAIKTGKTELPLSSHLDTIIMSL